jgi:hypothetical protein
VLPVPIEALIDFPVIAGDVAKADEQASDTSDVWKSKHCCFF